MTATQNNLRCALDGKKCTHRPMGDCETCPKEGKDINRTPEVFKIAEFLLDDPIRILWALFGVIVLGTIMRNILGV